MRLGLHAIGIAAGARREVIDSVAIGAEAHGFATLWAGEHVVMVDRPQSRYPYSHSGEIAVPASADWLDPLIGLSFAAAVTRRIRLATGVLLLPEHNPVLLAKQAASLDVLCGGRLTLGVGVGWSEEEFAALGIPFTRRGERAAEYLEAMRTLWRDDVASFDGEFVSFSAVRVNPKPLRRRTIPVVLGGNSDPALERVARLGDGWYGFNLAGVDAVRERIAVLHDLCRAVGRDATGLDLAVSLEDPQCDDLAALDEMGVSELVLVTSPPGDPGEIDDWIAELAGRWSEAASYGSRTSAPGPSSSGVAYPESPSVRSNSASRPRSTPSTPASPATPRPHR
jgi:probable F420-dependent oxidoreductase